jgi:hypothetical protein
MTVEKVSGGQTHWPTNHVARPANPHLASYRLGQVGGAPRGPIDTPLLVAQAQKLCQNPLGFDKISRL